MKVGILGAGVMGLATAWALAGRGHSVTVFDQGPIPNPVSSSFDSHRIIRHAYGAMRGYAMMMPAAFAAWGRLWDDLGHSHYVEAPATYCLRMEFDWYGPVSDTLGRMGIPFRDVPADEVARALPMVNQAGLLRVVETRGAGLLLADRIVTDLAGLVARQGVELRPHTRIGRVDAARGRLDDWEADMVVIAAGAWTEKLLDSLPEQLRASVQTVAYLEPPADLAAAWDRAPVLLNRLPLASGGVYVLPPRAGTRLKIGDYTHTFAGDPDAPRQARRQDVDNLMEAGAAAIADFHRYRLVETKACFYAVTADEHFAVRPLGERAWLLSACSGHGFKLAALVGETLAEGVSGARPAAEVQAYLAGRLTKPA
jgi:glycine/D-amino acid oxidase-like deaminating enzyme